MYGYRQAVVKLLYTGGPKLQCYTQNLLTKTKYATMPTH